jgi:hypothetical protein
MKILIILLINLICFQNQKIVVLNEKTEKPIESANLIFYENGFIIKSAYSNDLGEYFCNFSYDSLKVHSLGYIDKTITSNNKSISFVYLKDDVIKLNEVVLNEKVKVKTLGNIKKKSRKTISISKDERIAVFIKNENENEIIIKSILVNLKKVNFKCDLGFNIYSFDKKEKEYSFQNKAENVLIEEIIPNQENLLSSFYFSLEKNQEKIQEFELNFYDITLPKEGFFISIYVKNIYDDDNLLIEKPNYENFPILYMNRTKENNYCTKVAYNTKDSYWTNYNAVMRVEIENDDTFSLFPTNCFEPAIAIKVIEN